MSEEALEFLAPRNGSLSCRYPCADLIETGLRELLAVLRLGFPQALHRRAQAPRVLDPVVVECIKENRRTRRIARTPTRARLELPALLRPSDLPVIVVAPAAREEDHFHCGEVRD